jgi:transcriptional regulator with XRE-family HTH domain
VNTTQAAAGGPALRQAWEAAHARPTEIARALGVSARALHKWAEPGATVPPARVRGVAEQLRAAERAWSAERAEVLALVLDAHAAGRGVTASDVRRLRRRASTDVLLEELQTGPTPVVHVHEIPAVDGAGRTYVRRVLRPDPPARDVEPSPESALNAPTIRGLRLLAGYTQPGMAKRLRMGRGGRQQLDSWERGREQVPVARRQAVHDVLAAAVSSINLRERRESVGLSGAELARRAGVRKPALSVAERSPDRRPLQWSQLAVIGHVIDRAERDRAGLLAADVERLVQLVAAHEPQGLTRAELDRARGAGRTRGRTNVSDRDAHVLAAAIAERRLAWRDTAVRSAHGRLRTAARLHLAETAVLDDRMTSRELGDALSRAQASASELARELGCTWGTVSKWTRGTRTIAAPWIPRIRTALDALAARPRPDVSADLLAAAQRSPGLPPWRLLQEAGYGKSNPRGWAALDELIAAGRLHVEPRPHHSAAVAIGPAAAVERLDGTQLRVRRRAAGLRQRDFAAACGVEQTAVSYWERNGVPPERRQLVDQALAAAAS